MNDIQSPAEEWVLFKEFYFEAAHTLPNHDGKCSRLHGHSWAGRVYVKSPSLIRTGPKQGMVMDFSDVKAYLRPIVEDFLDHHDLNRTTGLENPTSEEIARWIYERLEESGLPGLHAVEIRETCTSGCRYQKRW